MTDSPPNSLDAVPPPVRAIVLDLLEATTWPLPALELAPRALDVVGVFAACAVLRPSQVTAVGADSVTAMQAATAAAEHLALPISVGEQVTEEGIDSGGVDHGHPRPATRLVSIDLDGAADDIMATDGAGDLVRTASLLTLHGNEDRLARLDLGVETVELLHLKGADNRRVAVVSVARSATERPRMFATELTLVEGLGDLLSRLLQLRASGMRADAVVGAAETSLVGDFGALAYDGFVAEAVRMRRLDEWINNDAAGVPGLWDAPGDPVTTGDPLLRWLLRLKWRVGRSRAAKVLRPIYQSVIGRRGA